MTDKRIDVFMDTQFSNGPHGFMLISLAMLTSEGDSFYAVSNAYNPDHCTPYVQKKVLPQVKDESAISHDEIRDGITKLIANHRPTFWAYCPSFDWVLTSNLWQGLENMPSKWPEFCLCVRQLALDHNVPSSSLPPKPRLRHHALENVHWARECHAELMGRIVKTGTIVRRSDTSS